MSRPPPALTTLLLLAALFPASVIAFPVPVLEKREDSSGSSVKVWVPIVAIMIILIALAVFYWSKGKGFRFFSPTSATVSAVGAAPVAQGTVREITAEQLAGTINDGANTTTGANARTRRTRRPHRTPSQISTISLPAYNKEPGDEELVIIRGPQDMEDVTMPTATVMPPVDEDGEVSVHTGDHSQASRYTPMPESPHHMPLLGGDNSSSGESSAAEHSPPGEDMPRRNYDVQNETSALARLDSNVSTQDSADPRGEAPPYFEVVDHQNNNNTNNSDSANQATVTRRTITPPSETTAILTATTPPASPERAQERRSGFRNLLNRMSVHSHARGDSTHSSVLTTTTSREGGASSRASHRPSHSGSAPFSTSMFRTISRQRSTTTLASNRLNSPSLISLNSISAPLTHTAVRTEFTYPKAGPTPEQLKLISSRESFARFGMPYGADAIAYASQSRMDLMSDPPPEFVESGSGSEVHLPRSAGAGPSRLRASSRAADLAREEDGDGDSTRSSSLEVVRDEPAADVSGEMGSEESHEMPSVREEEEKPEEEKKVSEVPVPAMPVSAELSRKASLTILTAPETSKETVAEPIEAQSPVMLPTPVSLKEAGISSKRTSVATIVPGPSTTTTSLPHTQILKEEEEQESIPTPTTNEKHLPLRKPSAPPSSFHSSSLNASRSESRASSMSTQSFETAAETLDTPMASAVRTADSDVSEPSTPRVGGIELGEEPVAAKA